MKKIIFYAPLLEIPSTTGPTISVENAIKALGSVSELHVLTPSLRASIPFFRDSAFFKKYARKVVCTPDGVKRTINFNNNQSLLRKIIKKVVINALFIQTTHYTEAEFIVKYFYNNNCDILWIDRAHSQCIALIIEIKKLSPAIPVVADTEAVHSRFILRELLFQDNPERKTEIHNEGSKIQADEKQVVNISDVTTAVSEIDQQYFKSLLSNDDAKIKLFYNTIDIEKYQTKVPTRIIQGPYLYMSGTFYGKNSPMENGARWVIENIYPAVREQYSEIKLVIAGRGSDEILADVQDPKIIITGSRPSLLPYMAYASVGLVPLKYESGTRFKILEYGAVKLPVVSTTLGAEGINVTHGKNIKIADDVDNFINAVLGLLENENNRIEMGNKLYQLIENSYSIDVQKKQALKIIQSMGVKEQK